MNVTVSDKLLAPAKQKQFQLLSKDKDASEVVSVFSLSFPCILCAIVSDLLCSNNFALSSLAPFNWYELVVGSWLLVVGCWCLLLAPCSLLPAPCSLLLSASKWHRKCRKNTPALLARLVDVWWWCIHLVAPWSWSKISLSLSHTAASSAYVQSTILWLCKVWANDINQRQPWHTLE